MSTKKEDAKLTKFGKLILKKQRQEKKEREKLYRSLEVQTAS